MENEIVMNIPGRPVSPSDAWKDKFEKWYLVKATKKVHLDYFDDKYLEDAIDDKPAVPYDGWVEIDYTCGLGCGFYELTDAEAETVNKLVENRKETEK